MGIVTFKSSAELLWNFRCSKWGSLPSSDIPLFPEFGRSLVRENDLVLRIGIPNHI